MKFITLIPTNRNDGSSVGKRELKAIIQRFYETFGGATVEGPLTGHWVEGNQAYHDQHLKVSVDCQNSQLDEARDMVL